MKIKLFLSVAVIIGILYSCEQPKEVEAVEMTQISGETMGTTYSIQYTSEEDVLIQPAVDSILQRINNSMSTYIPASLISQFNEADTTVLMGIDQYFYEVFVRSKEIYKASDGYFNPTVMPLVNYYGFGNQKEEISELDSFKVDSLLRLLQFEKATVSKLIAKDDTSYYVEKAIPELQLDFSAIAKGYAVDVLTEHMLVQGIENLYVEIGGELRTEGFYGDNPWRIGIDKPEEGNLLERKLFSIIEVTGKAVATSGNYRNFKEVNGQKMVHTINPKTGYPEINDLLSATVVADDCITADAFATAFMVMGKVNSLELVKAYPELEAFFIFIDEKGRVQHVATKGFEQMIVEKF